jgi:hypothetical protein
MGEVSDKLGNLSPSWYIVVKPTERGNDMSNTLADYWNNVEEAVQDAHLIAFDTCHKIYIALDEWEADWFRGRDDYEKATGTPDELLATLRKWYEASCPLRFISSVTRNEEDPNAGYTSVIPQGADEDDYEEEEDDWDENED